MQPVVEMRGITKRFGRILASGNPDLEMRGKVLGLIGPNGAGKQRSSTFYWAIQELIMAKRAPTPSP